MTTNTLLRLALAEKDSATGRVPLMPKLREKCRGRPGHPKDYWHGGICTKDADCICQGRGWTVTADSETIARSLWGVLKERSDTVQKFDYRWYMGAGHFAFAWEAAACALEEAGLMEKETP